MANPDKPQAPESPQKPEPPKAAPPAVSPAVADKRYEQRRAGLLPPDPEADKVVLAARGASGRR